ncbi:MAG TPA: hypothetical protein VKI65_20075 [Gemmataceae bacterium]|nr:hypothetical protein [Gemmataceae bacterium]
MSSGMVRVLFLIAAIYDIVLGLAFAWAFKTIYSWFGIELPNHDAYIQLPGYLIAIFGIGFLFVAFNPAKNRPLIFLGILLKLAFTGVALGHRFSDGIPAVYTIFAVLDLVFAALFLSALLTMKRGAAS